MENAGNTVQWHTISIDTTLAADDRVDLQGLQRRSKMLLIIKKTKKLAYRELWTYPYIKIYKTGIPKIACSSRYALCNKWQKPNTLRILTKICALGK